MGKGALNDSSATPRGAPLRNPMRFVRAVEATYESGNQSSYPKAVRVAMPAGIVPLLERAEAEETYECMATLSAEPTHVIAVAHPLPTGRGGRGKPPLLAEGHRSFSPTWPAHVPAHGIAVPHSRGRAFTPAGTGGHGSAGVWGGKRRVLREAT